MRFVEGVAGEGGHLVVNLLGGFFAHAHAHRAGDFHGAVGLHHAVDEIFLFLGHDVVLLFGHGLAHQIAAAQRIARQIAHDLHHLLLIDHAAIGHIQDGLELGRDIGHAGRIVLAADVARDGIHGPGPVERNRGDDILKVFRLHGLQKLAHAAAFQLEDAIRIAAGDQRVNGGIVHGDILRPHIGLALRAHHIQAVADHVERAQAQEVHLQKAQRFQRGHGELGGDHLVVGLQGHVIRNGPGRDEHARRVRGSVPGHALQLLRGIDQFAHALLGFIGGVQFGILLERALQRHIQGEGHHFGDVVDLRIAHAHHAAHIAQHAARGHGAKGDDLRHVIRAIFARHIGDDLAPALIIEIDIQIGHGHALRV